MPDIKTTPIARVTVAGKTQEITSSYADLHKKLSDVKGLLQALVRKKLPDVLGDQFSRLSSQEIDQAVEQFLKNGKLSADQINQALAASGVTPNTGSYVFVLPLGEYNVQFTVQELAALAVQSPPQNLKPSDTTKDVVRDVWIDSQYENLKDKGDLPADLTRTIDGNVLARTLESVPADQRDAYRILVLDRLREKKEKALRSYYEKRKESFEKAAQEAVLEARAGVEAESLPPEERAYENLADDVLAELKARGIVTADDLKGTTSTGLTVSQKMRLIFSLTEITLGERVDDDLHVLAKMKKIHGLLKGADKDHFLQIMHYALVEFPERLARESEVIARVKVNGEYKEIRLLEVNARIQETRNNEHLNFIKAVSTAFLYQKMEQRWNQWVLPQDPQRVFPKNPEQIAANLDAIKSILEKEFETRKKKGETEETFTGWLNAIETQSERISLGSLDDIRNALGFAATDRLIGQLKTPQDLYRSALEMTFQPYLQEGWYTEHHFTPPTRDDILAAMKKEENRGLNYDQTRDQMFVEKYFGAALGDKKSFQDIQEDYSRWLRSGVDQALTETLAPALKGDLAPQGRFAALRTDLIETGLLARGHQSYELAMLCTDLLPLIAPDTDVSAQTLPQTIEQVTTLLNGITDTAARRSFLSRLLLLKRVRDSIGREQIQDYAAIPNHKNPFALSGQRSLQKVALYKVLFSLNKPGAQGTPGEAAEQTRMWSDLRRALVHVENPQISGAPLGLEDFGSDVTICLNPKGEVQVRLDERKLNPTLYRFAGGEMDFRFWQNLSNDNYAESGQERINARLLLHDYFSDLTQLFFETDLKPADAAALTANMDFLRKVAPATGFLRRRAITTIQERLLTSLAGGEAPDFGRLLENAKALLNLQTQQQVDEFKAELSKYYTEGPEAAQRKGMLEQTVSEYFIQRVWKDPAPKDATSLDVKATLKDLPIPQDLLGNLQEPIHEFAEALNEARGTTDWDLYRRDFVKYINQDARLSRGVLAAEDLVILQILGAQVARIESGKAAQITAGFNLLHHRESRLFVESTVRDGLLSDRPPEMTIDYLTKIAGRPGTPVVVAERIEDFINSSAKEGLLNFGAPVTVMVQENGKLGFSSKQSTRIASDTREPGQRFVRLALRMEGFNPLEISNTGFLRLPFKAETVDVPRDPNDSGKDLALSVSRALNLTLQEVEQRYLKGYWQATFEYGKDHQLMRRTPPGEMPAVKDLVDKVLTERGYFPKTSKLATELAALLEKEFSATKETDVTKARFAQRLQSFGDSLVERWNYEHAHDPAAKAPAPLAADFIELDFASGLQWFGDFVLTQQFKQTGKPDPKELRGLLQNLCDDPALAGHTPEEMKAAIDGLLSLDEKKGWPARPARAQVELITVLLRRLGVPITGLPEGKDKDRPFVEPERMVLDFLAGEVADTLQKRFGISTQTGAWPVELLNAYRINSAFFNQADLKGSDRLGALPKQPAGKMVAVIRDESKDGQPGKMIGVRYEAAKNEPDYLLRELQRAATRLAGAVDFESGKKLASFSQTDCDKVIGDFFQKDVQKRLEEIRTNLARLEKLTPEQRSSLKQAGVVAQDFTAFWRDTKPVFMAQFSMNGEMPATQDIDPYPGRSISVHDAEALAAYLVSGRHTDPRVTPDIVYGEMQKVIATLDRVKAPQDDLFLEAEVRQALFLQNASAADADAVNKAAKTAKGDCRIFLSQLSVGPGAKYRQPILAHLLIRCRERLERDITPLTPLAISDSLLKEGQGLIRDLRAPGFAGLLVSDADAKALGESVTAMQGGDPNAATLLRTQLTAMEERWFKGSDPKNTAAWKSGPMAWNYLRLTARLNQEETGKFDDMRDLLATGRLEYARFNDQLIEKLTGVKDARFFISQDRPIKIALHGKAEKPLPGNYINLNFFGNAGAQRMLAQTVLSPSQFNRSANPLDSLQETLSGFGDGISVEQLITYNKPAVDALPSLTLDETRAYKLQKDLLEKNTKAYAAVVSALRRTTPDHAMPSPEEISRAIKMTNSILTGQTWFVINHEGTRSGKTTDRYLIAPKMIRVFNAPLHVGTEAVKDESETQLALRLFEGLMLNQKAYSPDQDFVTRSKDLDYGGSVLQEWTYMARQLAGGVDAQGRATETIIAARTTLQNGAGRALSQEQQALILRYANSRSYDLFKEMLTISPDGSKWLYADRAPETLINELAAKLAAPTAGGEQDSDDQKQIRTLLAGSPQSRENTLQAIRDCITVYCREQVLSLSQSGLNLGGPVIYYQSYLNSIAQQMETIETGLKIAAKNNSFAAFEHRDCFSLDRDLLSSILQTEESRLKSFALKNVVSEWPEFDDLKTPEQQAAALVHYGRLVSGDNELGVDELAMAFSVPSNPITRSLSEPDSRLLRKAAALARASDGTEPIEGSKIGISILERQFIRSSFAPVGRGKTKNLSTQSTYIPFQLDGREYTPTHYGTVRETESFPNWVHHVKNPLQPVVESTPGGLSFYEANPCADLHKKAPLFSIKLFLYSNNFGNQDPIEIRSDGTAYAHNDVINDTDLLAFAKMLDDSRFFPEKTAAKQDDVNFLKDFAKKLKENPNIRISDIYLYQADLPEAQKEALIVGEAGRRGLDVQTMRDCYRAIQMLKNFHRSLSAMIVQDGEDARMEQRSWIQSLNDMRQKGARGPLATIGRDLWATKENGCDMLYKLMEVTSLPDLGATNQVVDMRILQAKEILFANEFAKADEIARTNPERYKYLHDTTIDAEFIEKFLSNERFNKRLDFDYIGWVFNTTQKDDRIRRIVNDHGGPQKLLADMAASFRHREEKYPPTADPSTRHNWKSLNINFSDAVTQNDPNMKAEDVLAAKLVLQLAFSAGKIKPSDAQPGDSLADVRHLFRGPIEMVHFMWTTETEYAKNLKAHFIRKGTVGAKDGVDLFDDKINHAVVAQSAVEFREFMERYRNDKVKMIHMLAEQGFDFPGTNLVTDPAADAANKFAYVEQMANALDAAAADPNFQEFELSDIGVDHTSDGQKVPKALRILAAVAVPMQSKGQELQYNVGAAIYAAVGDRSLSSMQVISELKESGEGEAGLTFCRDKALMPGDLYWGDTWGEKVGKRSWEETLKTGKDAFYFRYAIHYQIAFEMQSAISVKLVNLSRAYAMGDSMAAHRLKEELKRFIKTRLTFVAFNINPIAMLGESLMRILEGESDEKIAAGIRLILLDLPFSKHSAGFAIDKAKSLAGGVQRLTLGRQYELTGVVKQGVDWGGMHDQIKNPARMSREPVRPTALVNEGGVYDPFRVSAVRNPQPVVRNPDFILDNPPAEPGFRQKAINAARHPFDIVKGSFQRSWSRAIGGTIFAPLNKIASIPTDFIHWMRHDVTRAISRSLDRVEETLPQKIQDATLKATVAATDGLDAAGEKLSPKAGKAVEGAKSAVSRVGEIVHDNVAPALGEAAGKVRDAAQGVGERIHEGAEWGRRLRGGVARLNTDVMMPQDMFGDPADLMPGNPYENPSGATYEFQNQARVRAQWAQWIGERFSGIVNINAWRSSLERGQWLMMEAQFSSLEARRNQILMECGATYDADGRPEFSDDADPNLIEEYARTQHQYDALREPLTKMRDRLMPRTEIKTPPATASAAETRVHQEMQELRANIQDGHDNKGAAANMESVMHETQELELKIRELKQLYNEARKPESVRNPEFSTIAADLEYAEKKLAALTEFFRGNPSFLGRRVRGFTSSVLEAFDRVQANMQTAKLRNSYVESDLFKANLEMMMRDPVMGPQIQAAMEANPTLKRKIYQLRGAPFIGKDPRLNPPVYEALQSAEFKSYMKQALFSPTAESTVDAYLRLNQRHVNATKIVTQVLYAAADDTSASRVWELKVWDGNFYAQTQNQALKIGGDKGLLSPFNAEEQSVTLRLSRNQIVRLLELADESVPQSMLKEDPKSLYRWGREKLGGAKNINAQLQAQNGYEALAMDILCSPDNTLLAQQLGQKASIQELMRLFNVGDFPHLLEAIKAPEGVIPDESMREAAKNARRQVLQETNNWLQEATQSLRAEIKNTMLHKLIQTDRATTTIRNALAKATARGHLDLAATESYLWDLYSNPAGAGDAGIPAEEMETLRRVGNRVRAQRAAGSAGKFLASAALTTMALDIINKKRHGEKIDAVDEAKIGGMGMVYGLEYAGIEKGAVAAAEAAIPRLIPGTVVARPQLPAAAARAMLPGASTVAGESSAAVSGAWSKAIRLGSGGIAGGVVGATVGVVENWGAINSGYGGIETDGWVNIGHATVVGAAGGVVFAVVGGALVASGPAGWIVIGVVIAGTVIVDEVLVGPLVQWIKETYDIDLDAASDMLDMATSSNPETRQKGEEKWMSLSMRDDRMKKMKARELQRLFPGGIRIGNEPLIQPVDGGDHVKVNKEFLLRLKQHPEQLNHMGLDELSIGNVETLNEITLRHLGIMVEQFKLKRETDIQLTYDGGRCMANLGMVTGSIQSDQNMWDVVGEASTYVDILTRDPIQQLMAIGQPLPSEPAAQLAFMVDTLHDKKTAYESLDQLYAQHLTPEALKTNPRWAGQLALERATAWHTYRTSLHTALDNLKPLPASPGLDKARADIQSTLAKLDAAWPVLKTQTMQAQTVTLDNSAGKVDATSRKIHMANVELALIHAELDGALNVDPQLHTRAVEILDQILPLADEPAAIETLQRQRSAHLMANADYRGALEAADNIRRCACENKDPAMYERAMYLYGETLRKIPQTQNLLAGTGFKIVNLSREYAFDLNPTNPLAERPIINIPDAIGINRSVTTLGPRTPSFSIQPPAGVTTGPSMTLVLRNLYPIAQEMIASCNGDPQKLKTVQDQIHKIVLDQFAELPADTKREMLVQINILRSLVDNTKGMVVPASAVEKAPIPSITAPSARFSLNRPQIGENAINVDPGMNEAVRLMLMFDKLLTDTNAVSPPSSRLNVVETTLNPTKWIDGSIGVTTRLTRNPVDIVNDDLKNFPHFAKELNKYRAQFFEHGFLWTDILNPDAEMTDLETIHDVHGNYVMHNDTVADPLRRESVTDKQARTGDIAKLELKKKLLSEPDKLNPMLLLAHGISLTLPELTDAMKRMKNSENRKGFEAFLATNKAEIAALRAEQDDLADEHARLTPTYSDEPVIAAIQMFGDSIDPVKIVENKINEFQDFGVKMRYHQTTHELLIDPAKWYQFLANGKPSSEFHDGMLWQVIAHQYGASAAGNINQIPDFILQGKIHYFAQQLKDSFWVGYKDPAKEDHIFDPDMLNVQLLLHRLGLLEADSIDGFTNVASVTAWNRYRHINELAGKSNTDILEHMASHIGQPFDQGKAKERAIAIYKSIGTFTDDEPAFERQLLGLSKDQIAMVDTALLRHTSYKFTIQKLADKYLENTPEDLEIVSHQMQGVFNPLGPALALGKPPAIPSVLALKDDARSALPPALRVKDVDAGYGKASLASQP